MNIAVDISPIKSGNFLQHRVRGTGFYTKNLIDALQKYYPENHYVFFSKGEKLVNDIQIIHIPYFEPYFLTIPFRKSKRTVVTVHDLTPLVFPDHFPSGIKGALKWQLQKISLKRVDAIITDSESSKNDILRFTGIDNSKVHTIHLAAAKEFMKIQLKREEIIKFLKKYQIPEKFALYVGDVTWNKNLPRLIKAIKMTNIPLVIVGKAITEKNFDISNPWNQDRIEIQKLIEEDSRAIKQIHCLGFIPDADLVVLYNLARVFVMPSIYEGFGLPILEAMGCGCPVVTSRESSLFGVAGEAARYIDAYSVDNIAKGIEVVFANKSLQEELSLKGFEQAKKFSWEKTVKKTVKVYETIVKKS